MVKTDHDRTDAMDHTTRTLKCSMTKTPNKQVSRLPTSKRMPKRSGKPALRLAPETKFYPVALSATWSTGTGTSIGTTPAILDIGDRIIEGTDVDDRVGREIYVDKLEFRATLIGGQSNLATDDKYNVFRLAVLAGTPGTMPLAIASNFSNSYFMDPRGMGGLDVVLFDRSFTLASPGRDSTGYMPPIKEIVIDVPVRRKLKYLGPTGSPSFRELYLVAVSDSSAAPNPGFANGFMTIHYHDV